MSTSESSLSKLTLLPSTCILVNDIDIVSNFLITILNIPTSNIDGNYNTSNSSANSPTNVNNNIHKQIKFIQFPKLIDLHQHLFNTIITPYNTQNLYNDILICLRCYFKLKFNEDVCLTNESLKTLIYNLLK